MRLKKIRVTFKDSLNFIQLPLSSFQTAFDLPVGKFDAVPFKYNTFRYLNDKSLIPRGTIPPLEAFLMEGMTKEKIRKLTEWHRVESERYARENEQYDVAAVMEEYCIFDVLTLLKGFQKFRIDFALLGCKTKKLDILWAVSTHHPPSLPLPSPSRTYVF